MASLLDSILASMQAGNGSTGILGSGPTTQSPTDSQSQAANQAWLEALMGATQGVQKDPYSSPSMMGQGQPYGMQGPISPIPASPAAPMAPAAALPATGYDFLGSPTNIPSTPAPAAAAPSMASPQNVAPIPVPQGPMPPAPAAASAPAPSPMPPVGATPVSLPVAPPAAAPVAAPQRSPFGGFNNYIDNNRATLMALAGGLASGGIGQGFTNAAGAALEQNKLNFEAMKPVKIGTDSYGADIFAVRDLKSPTGFRKIDLGELSPTSPAASGLKGEDYLKALPAGRQAIVKGLANYDIDPRTLSVKGGHRERLLEDVMSYRPGYDQKNYAASADAVKKFNTGPQGNSVVSFNRALDHLDQLNELGKAMNNGDLPAANAIKNQIVSWTGGAAPNNFEGLKAIVGQEIVKAIVANGGGEREREEAAKRISSASSPDQLNGIIQTYKGAMGAQLSALKRQYETSTYREDFETKLSPKAIAEMKGHEGASGAAVAPQSGGGGPKDGDTATNPQTGAKIIWRGGQWVPVGGPQSAAPPLPMLQT